MGGSAKNIPSRREGADEQVREKKEGRGSSADRMEDEGEGVDKNGRRKSEAQSANKTSGKGGRGDGPKTPRSKGGGEDVLMRTPSGKAGGDGGGGSRRKSKEGGGTPGGGTPGGSKTEGEAVDEAAIPKDDTDPACLVYSHDGKLLLAGNTPNTPSLLWISKPGLIPISCVSRSE